VAENSDRRGVADGDASTALVPRPPDDRAISFVQFTPQPPYDERLVFWERRESETAASFRLLRQRLIERGDPKIVLCTSAAQGEGKSTLAANLALSYAELGRHRVLLLEASFRGAALGEMFGFKPPSGFARQLITHRSHPDTPWIVVQLQGMPLYIMAAEPRCCQKCAAVLAEDATFCGMCGTALEADLPQRIDAVAFAAAMRKFRESFNYVVIDAPSVLSSGDVNLIQDSVEAILFATRKGRSAGRDLKRAIEQVSPAEVAAVVMLDE
jgi:Mrp family chromosome partitioning ATPase